MASTVNKYRVWCTSEEQWRYVWDESPPLHCPDNSEHDIDTDATSIVDTVSIDTVEIKEENTPTGGHYQAYGITIDLPSGVGWTTTDVTFPHPISLMTASWGNRSEIADDEGMFQIAPDTIVGVLTAQAASGSTVLYVSDTVISNMWIGTELSLYNGANKDVCGRVIAINAASGTVTVETANTHVFAAGTTYVLMTVYMLRSSRMDGYGALQLGACKIGGSYVPANTIIRAKYKNNSGVAKKLTFYMEYLY